MPEIPQPMSREENLEAPTRYAVPWKEASFHDREQLFGELERVFGICHSCRRCVNLCNAFPTLFDLVDAAQTSEVGGVDQQDYWKVSEQCYLCDLCYMTKCPYVPPHSFNVDFPHLMLRAKAVRRRERGSSLREQVLSSTDLVGAVAGLPGVAAIVNAFNSRRWSRRLLEWGLGVHREAVLPRYHSPSLRRRRRRLRETPAGVVRRAGSTHGRIALFVGCYGNRHEPGMVEDLVTVLEHNDIPVRLPHRERCCGMPKLECGDLPAVEKLKRYNIPVLAELARGGWDLTSPVPSCVLMFRRELPLLFPGDEDVEAVRRAFFDPCEYLLLRHRSGLLNTDFKHSLGTVAHHAACHQRVQNIGPKTRELLQLVPGTRVSIIERCSGHDGTYAVKRETRAVAVQLAGPAARSADAIAPDFFTSDCPLAGTHIGHCMKHPAGAVPRNPFALLRLAYGLQLSAGEST